MQNLTRDDINLVTDLAYEVVRRQQHKIVVMSFNLTALIYNEQTFIGAAKDLTMWQLKRRLLELAELFESLGAIVALDIGNINKDIRDTFSVHNNILEVAGSNSNIKLIRSNVDLDVGPINAAKLKGTKLSNEVMNIAVPTFSLQLYCNPTLYWLAQPAFFVLASMGRGDVTIPNLRKDIEMLRKVFIYEFVLYPGFADEDFDRAMNQLLTLGILKKSINETVQLDADSKYVNLLLSAVAPFLNCYLNTSRVILENLHGKDFTEKDVFIAAQSHLEGEILNGKCDVHPYALCLDSINMAILSFCNSGSLNKVKQLSASCMPLIKET